MIYDGILGGRDWWIVHIEPTGAVNVWKRPEGAVQYQRLLNGRLELGWRSISGSVVTFVGDIVASLDIEGLSVASPSGPSGGVENLSEITYKVTPVSE